METFDLNPKSVQDLELAAAARQNAVMTFPGQQAGPRQSTRPDTRPDTRSDARPDTRSDMRSDKRSGRTSRIDPLHGLAHDARNVLAALRLYSELLGEPGVLTPEHRHYAAELHAIATASAGLVEQVVCRQRQTGRTALSREALPDLVDGVEWIDDLGAAIRNMEGLLSGIAGPQVEFEIECMAAAGAVRLSPEGLARILGNLICNAAEAMPRGGRIRVTVQQDSGGSFRSQGDSSNSTGLLLCVQDNGPGIAAAVLERVFDRGFSTRANGAQQGRWPSAANRGLGLSIVRSLVEGAGGKVRAVSAPGRGTRFELQFPAFKPTLKTFVTGSREERRIEC